MNDITIGQAWMWVFENVGIIPLGLVTASFNIVVGTLLIKYSESKFWRIFGWVSVTIGVFNLLARTMIVFTR